MKLATIVLCWMLLTAGAAALVPSRQQPQPIAYTRPVDDLQRDFPTNDTSPGQRSHWLRTVQLNTLSTQPRARSAPTQGGDAHPLLPRLRVAAAAPTGTCAEWVAAAGIVDTASAFELIARESGCRPYAVNPYSSACGIPQALPCSKMDCPPGDGACQVRWMDGYVVARYSTWANALAFQKARGWY